MIEIITILAALVVLLGAAKKRPRRRSTGFTAISVTVTLALSTLATDTVIKVNVFTTDFAENFYAISAEGVWTMRENVAGETPIQFGFAHSDYSVAEIAEKLVSDEANIRGDKVAQEQSRRQVRLAGAIADSAATDMMLNNGTPVKTPLRMKIGNDFNLAMWARNRSGSNLTGNTRVQFTGKIFGRYTS